jgi:hypothetical protein
VIRFGQIGINHCRSKGKITMELGRETKYKIVTKDGFFSR